MNAEGGLVVNNVVAVTVVEFNHLNSKRCMMTQEGVVDCSLHMCSSNENQVWKVWRDGIAIAKRRRPAQK